MRILHLTNEMSWRGGENQTRLLIEGCSKLGHQSFVALPKSSHAVNRFKQVAEVLELPSRSLLDPRNVAAIVQFCCDKNIDLLDAQSSGGMTWGLRTKKKLPHLKLVVHRRTAFPIKQNWLSKKKYLSPLVDRYVCISEAIREILIAYGIDRQKIVTVKSAIESSNYEISSLTENRKRWRKKLDIPDDIVLVACASALTGEKGHDMIIEACRLVRAKTLNFKVIFAGTGSGRTELEELVHQSGLKDLIHFAGFIEDISGFLSAVDILMMPSRSEGLGTILLEGALAGCALIGTSVGGIPEVIIDGETGFLVPVDQPEVMADRLLKLIQDDKLREQLSKQVKTHVSNHFSLDQMVQGNARIFEELKRGH